MKKLLFGLAAILSVSALAQDYHVYVGGGFDFFNNPFTAIKEAKAEDPEKGTDSTWKNSVEENKKAAKNHVYRNAALESMKNVEKILSLGEFNLKLEGTKTISDNLELGIGVKYINEKQAVTTINKEDFKTNVEKDINALK